MSWAFQVMKGRDDASTFGNNSIHRPNGNQIVPALHFPIALVLLENPYKASNGPPLHGKPLDDGK